MSRTLKRPMFRRGGTVNDGIMTGLTDRKQLALYPESMINRQASAAYEKFRNNTKLSVGWSDHSNNPFVVYRAVEKWNEWIYQSGGQIGSQMLDDALNPMGPFKSLPSVRRLYSKGEYQADIGFGRQFGSSQGINLPRGGYGQDVSRPPSVYIAGEGWADKKSVPLGWVEERADGVPTGKWIPDETPMPSEFEPTGIIGLETELLDYSI